MLTTPGHEKTPGAETLHARPRALSNDRARAVPTKRRNAMSFSDHKITAFTHKIADLPDQPNLPADELKARFDSSPEELRQSLNAICDDAARLDTRVSGIVAETFGDAIPKSMLSDELAAELDAKATQTALDAETAAREAEAAARESADSALSTRVSSLESAVPQKCQIYIGTYTGDGATSRTISLGFRPKAVLVYCEGYIGYNDGRIQGGLILDGTPMTFSSAYQPAAEIISSGFIVRSNDQRHQMNINQVSYSYLALRA